MYTIIQEKENLKLSSFRPQSRSLSILIPPTPFSWYSGSFHKPNETECQNLIPSEEDVKKYQNRLSEIPVDCFLSGSDPKNKICQLVCQDQDILLYGMIIRREG